MGSASSIPASPDDDDDNPLTERSARHWVESRGAVFDPLLFRRTAQDGTVLERATLRQLAL